VDAGDDAKASGAMGRYGSTSDATGGTEMARARLMVSTSFLCVVQVMGFPASAFLIVWSETIATAANFSWLQPSSFLATRSIFPAFFRYSMIMPSPHGRYLDFVRTLYLPFLFVPAASRYARVAIERHSLRAIREARPPFPNEQLKETINAQLFRIQIRIR
jgi:hypothetical protein